jgi:hypothetical protein
MRELYIQHENGRHGHIRQYEGQWLVQVYAAESRKRREPMVRQFVVASLQDARYTLRRAMAQ